MAISQEIRQQVVERARHCCEHCQSQLTYSADSFSVEHIVPRSKGGSDNLFNLALACQRCNNAKFVATEATDPLTGQVAPLFHPRNDEWASHFRWSHDLLRLQGISPTGRATIERLRLNREGVVNLRRVLRDAGEHPIQD